MDKEIVVILHNIRSTYNVGSILRSCDGFAVDKVYFSGYTPYPKINDDTRLPHISNKIDKQISKTSLGAEKTVLCELEDVYEIIPKLKNNGFEITALEQSEKSIQLDNYDPPNKLALIVGEEIGGVDSKILNSVDKIVEIPMRGDKESFNVSVATAIALYQVTFGKKQVL